MMDKHNNNVASITETDRRLKKATIIGIKGNTIKQRVSTMAKSVTMVEKQIEMLEKTKAVLVQQWGGAKYNEKITELMEKMLDDFKMSGDDLVEQNTGGGQIECGDKLCCRIRLIVKKNFISCNVLYNFTP